MIWPVHLVSSSQIIPTHLDSTVLYPTCMSMRLFTSNSGRIARYHVSRQTSNSQPTPVLTRKSQQQRVAKLVQSLGNDRAVHRRYSTVGTVGEFSRGMVSTKVESKPLIGFHRRAA